MNPKFKSDLAELVGPAVVVRDVEFNGKSKAFHFRILSGEAAEELFFTDETQAVRKQFRARVIAKTVCDAEGKDVLSADEAAKLPNQFQTLLSEVCLDVNGLSNKGKEAAEKKP